MVCIRKEGTLRLYNIGIPIDNVNFHNNTMVTVIMAVVATVVLRRESLKVRIEMVRLSFKRFVSYMSLSM